MKEKLLKSSLFRVIEIATVTLVSLALTPYLIKHLGDENYGLWLLVLSTLGWFNFIDLGFSAAVRREIAIALENNSPQRINVVFSVSVALFATLGLIASAGVLLLASFPELLGVVESNQQVAALAFYVLALKVFFDFMMNSFHGFFTAYIRMDIDANISLFNTLFKSLLIVLLIQDMNIMGAVAATIVADICAHLLKIYYAKKLNSGFDFSFSYVSVSEVKSLFSYSKHLVAAGVANTVLRRSDPVVISHILGLKFVALYGVINNLINQLENLVIAVVGVFNPMMNRLVARKIPIEGVFRDVIDINFFIVLVLYVPLAVLAEDFIYLWIGKEYANYAYLASILGFAYICRAISRPITALLLAQANHKLISLVSLFGALLNIAMSVIFAQIWGLAGVASATAISFFISEVLLSLMLLKRYNKFLISGVILKFVLLSTVYVFCVVAGKYVAQELSPLSWIELFVTGGVVVLTITFFSWIVILGPNMRQRLIDMLQRKQMKDI